MKFTEFTGKTVDEAVEIGLKTLGLTKENAVINVLEEGKKKLFGAVKARVEIEAKEENAETVESADVKADAVVLDTEETDGQRAVQFLEGLFKILNVTACTELVSEGEKIEINVTAADSTAVIGKRGVMLDAIQTLAGAVANTGRDDYKRVVVDCENYRENRENTLKKLANNLSEKAKRLQKKIKLEPMNPYERRIIHAALSEIEGVSTKSEGKEPNRYIVIIPDNVLDPNEPAIPARAEHGNGNRRSGSRDGFKKPYGSKDNFKKPYNKKRQGGGYGSSEQTGGTTLKNTNFFGTFLGNSKDQD